MVEIMKKAASVGLLMIDIPEAYGGLQVDKTTSMIVSERVSKYAGFAATYGAQTTIGMLPTLYFGTEDKNRVAPEAGQRRGLCGVCADRAGQRLGRAGRQDQGRARPRTASTTCSTARRCGSRTRGSPTSTPCSARSTAISSPRFWSRPTATA